MVINIKYYVITILAIFLAIGVGIFIGIMLDGQDLIAQQQQQIVTQLQKEFNQIKEIQDTQQIRIDELIEERSKNLKFIDIVYPEVIKDKLKGLNIIILETNEDYSYFSLVDSFEKAGVNSVTNILIKDQFLLADDNIALTVSQRLKLSGDSKEEIQSELIKYLLDSLISADQKKLSNLKELDLVDYLGNIMFPMSNLVIASGNSTEEKTRLNKIDIPMVEFTRANNVPLLMVEKTTVTNSVVQEFKKLRISTVDNADTLIGKLSIIMVILGKEGNFGEKSTSESLLPEDFVIND